MKSDPPAPPDANVSGSPTGFAALHMVAPTIDGIALNLTINAPLAFSIEHLAESTSISRSFLYEEVNAGRIEVSKVGSRSIIPIWNAIAWLASLPKLPRKSE